MTAPVVWMNGRHAVDWEIPEIERAIEGERERELGLLAGVLAGEPPRPAPPRPRPVTDLPELT